MLFGTHVIQVSIIISGHLEVLSLVISPGFARQSHVSMCISFSPRLLGMQIECVQS